VQSHSADGGHPVKRGGVSVGNVMVERLLKVRTGLDRLGRKVSVGDIDEFLRAHATLVERLKGYLIGGTDHAIAQHYEQALRLLKGDPKPNGEPAVHDQEVVVRDEDGDELVIYERHGRTRIGVAARDGRGYAVIIDAKGAEKIIKRLLEMRGDT
jgi:hypothetical protein